MSSTKSGVLKKGRSVEACRGLKGRELGNGEKKNAGSDREREEKRLRGEGLLGSIQIEKFCGGKNKIGINFENCYKFLN